MEVRDPRGTLLDTLDGVLNSQSVLLRCALPWEGMGIGAALRHFLEAGDAEGEMFRQLRDRGWYSLLDQDMQGMRVRYYPRPGHWFRLGMDWEAVELSLDECLARLCWLLTGCPGSGEDPGAHTPAGSTGLPETAEAVSLAFLADLSGRQLLKTYSLAVPGPLFLRHDLHVPDQALPYFYALPGNSATAFLRRDTLFVLLTNGG